MNTNRKKQYWLRVSTMLSNMARKKLDNREDWATRRDNAWEIWWNTD